MQRYIIIADGRVQGVGYRYFVKHQAVTYNVKGHVKNLPGGKVEIDAEGSPENLRLFFDECRKGTPLARVEQFLQHEVTPYGYTRFRILRHEEM